MEIKLHVFLTSEFDGCRVVRFKLWSLLSGKEPAVPTVRSLGEPQRRYGRGSLAQSRISTTQPARRQRPIPLPHECKEIPGSGGGLEHVRTFIIVKYDYLSIFIA